MSAMHPSCMACSLALALVAFVLRLQPCLGTAATDRGQNLRNSVPRHSVFAHNLRGHPHGHQHKSPVQSDQSFAHKHPTQDKPEEAVEGGSDSMAPLYDDFLDVMNNAAAKALKQQRAIPAYDDFLHLMKAHAEKAYKEQAGPPSYDEFLNFMKGKTDEAYHQQVELPSYNDFLTALKESSVEALKTPVPTYEQFLNVLKAGAERAMQKRHVRAMRAMHSSSIKTFKKQGSKEPIVMKRMNQNPLDRIPYGKEEAERDDDDESKLKEELRELQAKQKEEKNHNAKKPLMQRINVLRTQLCWKRPNLWQHEKCLRFLGIHCLQESTGEGICRAFTKEAKKRCETSTDPDWKEDYCALAEALAESYGEDEEEDADEETIADADEGEGADADGEKEKNADGDEIGSDDDLEKENEEMDKELLGEEKKAEAMDADHDEGDDVVEDEQAKQETLMPDGDRDGDGVKDELDKFPDDPNEWKDTDGDGIGDNADEDLDGDGHNNDVDRFPADPKEWADSDNDGIGDNADKDRDNDGYDDDKDVFPDDPTEWLDSDKDGVGDNADAYPFNPNCHRHDDPCEDIKKMGMPKEGSSQDPATLDMDAMRPLPDQGYNEHMNGPPVNHNNYYTWVSDWQEEWPEMERSEGSTLRRICREHPENSWCDRFKSMDAHFR